MRFAFSFLATLSIGVGVVACGNKEAPPPPRATYQHSIAFEKDPPFWFGKNGAAFLVDGKEVGRYDRYVRFELPGDKWLTDPATKVAVRLDTTCGVQDVPV